MSIDDRIKELAKKWCLHPTDNAWDEVMGFAYDLIADEREACAKVVEADGLARGNEGLVLIKAAGRIRARGIDGATVGEVGAWGEEKNT